MQHLNGFAWVDVLALTAHQECKEVLQLCHKTHALRCLYPFRECHWLVGEYELSEDRDLKQRLYYSTEPAGVPHVLQANWCLPFSLPVVGIEWVSTYQDPHLAKMVSVVSQAGFKSSAQLLVFKRYPSRARATAALAPLAPFTAAAAIPLLHELDAESKCPL